MSFETGGEIAVDVDRASSFEFVRDARRLATCIPGCRDLNELSAGRYSAVLTSQVAFMILSFKAVIQVVKMDPPNAIEADITCDAIGLPGHIVAKARMELTEAGEHHTAIRYVADVSLTGKLGGLGQPVFRATSARLANEFGANLKKAVEARRTETLA